MISSALLLLSLASAEAGETFALPCAFETPLTVSYHRVGETRFRGRTEVAKGQFDATITLSGSGDGAKVRYQRTEGSLEGLPAPELAIEDLRHQLAKVPIEVSLTRGPDAESELLNPAPATRGMMDAAQAAVATPTDPGVRKLVQRIAADPERVLSMLVIEPTELVGMACWSFELDKPRISDAVRGGIPTRETVHATRSGTDELTVTYELAATQSAMLGGKPVPEGMPDWIPLTRSTIRYDTARGIPTRIEQELGAKDFSALTATNTWTLLAP